MPKRRKRKQKFSLSLRKHESGPMSVEDLDDHAIIKRANSIVPDADELSVAEIFSTLGSSPTLLPPPILKSPSSRSSRSSRSSSYQSDDARKIVKIREPHENIEHSKTKIKRVKTPAIRKRMKRRESESSQSSPKRSRTKNQTINQATHRAKSRSKSRSRSRYRSRSRNRPRSEVDSQDRKGKRTDHSGARKSVRNKSKRNMK